MEGGLLPWKVQKLEGLPVVIEELTSKSLPPPPCGYFWEHQANGEWKLLRLPAPSTENMISFKKPSIVEHTVMPTDTLQGICLKYRISAVELRRLNLFSGNNIQIKKSLLIPLQGGAAVTPQENSRDVILQRFRNITSEGVAESRLYLEEHNWDLNTAVQAWRQDENWEEDHVKEFSKNPPNFAEEDNDEEDNTTVTDEYPVHATVAPIAIEYIQETVPAYISLTYPELSALTVDALTDPEDPQQTLTQPILLG
jgi:LysM repeat protein